MNTYPIGKTKHSLIPFGSKSGKPCVMLEFCEKAPHLTAGQIIEKVDALSGDIKELILSGHDPANFIDYDVLCALRNHGYTINILTDGSRKLSFGLGMVDHIIIKPNSADIEIELAHDLILTRETFGLYKELKNFKFEQGYLCIGNSPFTEMDVRKFSKALPAWNVTINLANQLLDYREYL